jgi:hypothetical protein
MSWDMIKEPALQMGTDKMTQIYAFHKPFTVKLTSRNEWDRGLVPIQGGLIWYTDRSKTNADTGTGVYDHGMRERSSASAQGSITRYSRLNYILLKHVLMRILKGAILIGSFIFCQRVKLQLRHLTIVRFTQDWSGTAINPL